MRCAIAFLLAALLTAAPVQAAEAIRRLRVAGAQLPVTQDVNANLAALERAVRYAVAQKADVLLTPEGSLSGYFTEFDAAKTASALERITAVARRAGVALALGTCFEEPTDGRRYDELRFYDRKGRYLGFHPKILLCRHVSEPGSKGEIDYFKTRPLRTFELEGIIVGGLVCNDMWANPEWTPQNDPHLSQQLASKGARVIFHSVNSGLAQSDELLELNRHYHDSNLRIRARAGKLWIVVVDAADPKGMVANQAPSGIVDPAGNWVVRVENKGEQFFAYTIELQ